MVDVFLKETNLKDIQTRSRLRLLGVSSLYGDECDKNTSFEIKKKKNISRYTVWIPERSPAAEFFKQHLLLLNNYSITVINAVS